MTSYEFLVHLWAGAEDARQLRGQLYVRPDSVRWTPEAVAQIAIDEDHARGLLKRHVLR